MREYAPGARRRGVEAVFAVADATDAFAGTVALRLVGDESTTPLGDVGYLMGSWGWGRGRGLASAALRTVCAWGFRSLGLHRIEWRALVGNDASRRVAQRAGFTVEGLARVSVNQRGVPHDAWVGALLATDPAS